MDSAFDCAYETHNYVLLRLGKVKDLGEVLFMIENSKFFLSDLVKQPEISVGPEAYQCADFVANVFHCIILCDADDHRLRIH